MPADRSLSVSRRRCICGGSPSRNVPGASELSDLSQSTVAIFDQSTVAILDTPLPAPFGHGTIVAGLIHLVAPTAGILPLKAFNADG